MRIVLCGQKAFGAAALDLIVKAGHSVIGVWAPADARDGSPDRLQARAAFYGLPRHPSGSLRVDTLPAGTDLVVAAHSHDFIGRATRLRSKLGAVGYHPSLLPIHRGRDAVRWTIRLGDRIAGGSMYWLDDRVDAGDLAAQDWCFVRPGDTAEELWRRDLFPMGLRLLGRVLTDLERGRIVAVPQDEALATWEPALDAPPLRRPDLPMIGPAPEGYTVIRERAA